MSNLRPVPLGHPLMGNNHSEPHPAAVAAANAMAAAATASSASRSIQENTQQAAADTNDADADAQSDGGAQQDGAAVQDPSTEQPDEESQPQQQQQQQQQQQAPSQPPAPSAALAPIPDTLDELHAQEAHVDPDILKTAGNLSTTTPYTLPAGAPALGPFGLAHARSPFVLTVLAVHAIVNGKLYKHAGANLEDYFKSRFGISRAQVYRVLDCAALYMDFELRFPSLPLHLLEPYPLKQRLCKTIRSLAPTPYLRQLLWHCTLRKWVVPPPPPARPPIIRREVIVHSDGEEEEIEVEHVVPPPLPAAVISVDELTSKHVRDVWDLLVLRADVRQLLELAITQVNDMYNGAPSATVPAPTSGAAAAAAASASATGATDDPSATGSSNDDSITTTANGDMSAATSTSNLSTLPTSPTSDQQTPPGGAALGLVYGPLGMELPSIPCVAIDTYTPRSMRDRSPSSGDPRPTKRPRRSSTTAAASARGRRGSVSSASAAGPSPTMPEFKPTDILFSAGAPPSPRSPAFQPLSTHADGASHLAPPASSAADLAALMDDPMDGTGSTTTAAETSAAAYSWNQITSQYANATAASLAAYGRAGPPAPAPPEINYSRLRADSPRSLSPLGESDEEEMVMRRAEMEKGGDEEQGGVDAEEAAGTDKEQQAQQQEAAAAAAAPPAVNKIARPLPPPPAAFAMATPQSRSGMPSPLLIHQGHIVNGASGEPGSATHGLGLRVNQIVRPASLHSSVGLPPPPPAPPAPDANGSSTQAALSPSGPSSRARSRNGTAPNGSTQPGDSPVFSLPMIRPTSAAGDPGMLSPTAASSAFMHHPFTHPGMFPMHQYAHGHTLPNLPQLPLPPPAPPAPPRARAVADLDINSAEMHEFLCSTIESLQELARRGIVLQPLVNSVWLNDVTHWRFYTMQSAQAQAGAALGQGAASETAAQAKVGNVTTGTGGQQDGAGGNGGCEADGQGGGAASARGANGLQVNGLDLADAPPVATTVTRARPITSAAAPPARLATSASAAIPRTDSGMALPLTTAAAAAAGQMIMLPPTSMPGSVDMDFGHHLQQQQYRASGSVANAFANGPWMVQGSKPAVNGWSGHFGQQQQQQPGRHDQ